MIKRILILILLCSIATQASSQILYGGSTRLPNGNTFITNGETGLLFIVTPEKATVWQHDTGGQLFKAVYIPTNEPDLECEGRLNWDNIEPGATLYSSFTVKNVGGPNLNWKIQSYPNWGTWKFTPESGENLNGETSINVEVIAPPDYNQVFEGDIKLVNEDNPNDSETIPIYLRTPRCFYTEWNSYFFEVCVTPMPKYCNWEPLELHIVGGNKGII